MTEPLLTATQVIKRLGWSESKFYRYRHTHAIASMKSRHAVGKRCYIAAEVDKFNQGQSTTRLIRRDAVRRFAVNE